MVRVRHFEEQGGDELASLRALVEEKSELINYLQENL
jgi:hypothetical protein